MIRRPSSPDLALAALAATLLMGAPGPLCAQASDSLPPVTLLYQNFPNPFPRAETRGTRIWFDLAESSPVRLEVFDLHGRLVRRLIPDASGCGQVVLDGGSYGRIERMDPPCASTVWDARDASGARVPAGVYVIRLWTEQGTHTVRTLYRP